MKPEKTPSPLPFRVSVCGRAELPRFAGSLVTHLISIDNPAEPTRTPEWFKGVHCHAVFQDVVNADEAREFNAVPPAVQDVERLLAFGRRCMETSQTQKVHLLVHCTAGASRSPAVAFAIICLALGEGRENEAMRLLLSIKPDVYPNSLVVKYADDLLDRKGRMVEALRPLREEFVQAADEWGEPKTTAREGDRVTP